jgi:TonB-linked SusC/RagA family outer membrane protein
MKQLYLRQLYLVALLTLFSIAARAQDMSISGKVVSGEDGAGLPGVSVTIKGSVVGTSTSANGLYNLSAAKGVTLVFSSVGYTTEEVVIGESSTIDMTMTLDIMTLSDVVVVGYGTQEKRDVVAAISQVKAADFKNVSVPSFDAALQGRATGIQIVQSSGIPGSAVRVRVRGQGSIASGGDPLYVIDGVPQEVQNYGSVGFPRPAGPANNNPLASLNPNDIESVEVLKDAEACAIFGARAGNGAILITTKKGKSGQTTIELGYYTGISSPTKKLKMLNAQQWATLYMEGYKNDSIERAKTSPVPLNFRPINGIPMNRDSITRAIAGLGHNTDWLDETVQSGKLQEANISARGGNEKTRFYASGSYRSDEGILKGSKFERVSGRLNLENSASEKLDVGAQVNVSFTKNQQVATSYTGGVGAAQSNALPLWPVYNPNGSYFGTQYFNTGNNPVAQRENSYVASAFKTITNFYGNYKIGRGFSFRQDFSLDMYNQIEEE